MTVRGGEHEWRVAVEVFTVWVGAVRQQRQQTVDVAEARSPQQRLVEVLLGILFKLARQHPLQRRQVALRRYRHQRTVHATSTVRLVSVRRNKL